jgi:tetrahydromethanopterin S-methyltransferase subunit G
MSLDKKVQELIINEDKIKNYFFTRESEEYLKIKSPITYLESTINYFNGEMQRLMIYGDYDLGRLLYGQVIQVMVKVCY